MFNLKGIFFLFTPEGLVRATAQVEIATGVQSLTAFTRNSNRKPLNIMSEYEGISAFQQDVTKHLPAAASK